jgi:bifunctional DNase/RNase
MGGGLRFAGWGVAAVGLLAVLTTASAPTALRAASGKSHEMEVVGVAPTEAPGQAVILLRGKQDPKRELTMVIGTFEAQSIALALRSVKPPRPLTHDLMASLVGRLNGKVRQVVITELRLQTYFASIHLQGPNGELQVDSRPSDAIALALRVGAPILAEEQVLGRPPAREGGETI